MTCKDKSECTGMCRLKGFKEARGPYNQGSCGSWVRARFRQSFSGTRQMWKRQVLHIESLVGSLFIFSAYASPVVVIRVLEGFEP